MALFRHFRGSRSSLDTQPLHDGYAYFCVDDGTFHIDYADENGNLYRKQINAKDAETLMGAVLSTVLNSSDTEIPTSKAVTDAIANLIKDVVSVAGNGIKITKSEGIVTLDWDPDVVFVFNGGTSVINV